MDRLAIAGALREIAALLSLRGDNRFKTRAFDRGASSLEAFEGDLVGLDRENKLHEIPGIGRTLAAMIHEMLTTGRSSYREQLQRELPPGVLDLARVPGLGVGKIQQLHDALGIRTVADLAAACEAGLVRNVRGFGPRTEQRILDGIRVEQSGPERVLLSDALTTGTRLLEHLRAHPATDQVEFVGSMRRNVETVANIDLLAATSDMAGLAAHLGSYPPVTQFVRAGAHAAAVLANGPKVDLHMASASTFPTALVQFTGSRAHVEKLRAIARQHALYLRPWGLFRIDGLERLTLRSEADVYRAIGLPWIAPELREDHGEIEQALAGKLADDLVSAADIQGMVHCHTVYSDGRNTVEEMARAADAMGMKYLTITDHSPTASYAGGVTLDRLKRQWDEIARVQETVNVKLLRGTESDILADGGLDYPDAVLESFEVIIASVHSRYKMDEAQMTERIVRAMRIPVFKIWGHALGRLLLSRPPFACRVEEVLDAIAQSPAAIEINGDPRRLDLEPRWIRVARERGIRFVVSADAHSTSALQYIHYGVGIARRGGVRRGEVLNTLPTRSFMRAVRPAQGES